MFNLQTNVISESIYEDSISSNNPFWLNNRNGLMSITPLYFEYQRQVLSKYNLSCVDNITTFKHVDDQKSIVKHNNLKKLNHISKLQYDWNGYGAEAIPYQVIALSINIILMLDEQPEIYPTARQTIQMEYELPDESYLEFEIYANQITVLEVPKRNYSLAKKYILRSDEYRAILEILSTFLGGLS